MPRRTATSPQTPDEYRAEYFACAERVGPVLLHPLSLATIWLLELAEHPLNSTTPTSLARLSFRDTATAIFIFAEPDAAFAALEKGPDEFRRQTMRLARCIDGTLLPKICAAMGRLIKRGFVRPSSP